MTDFLLVHGAWHGAWCWDRVLPLLEPQGQRTTALSLPGVGERAAELAADVDLSCHARAVADAVRSHVGKLIVVAHSYAGAVVRLACENVADRLAGCIYLDSSVLEDGEKMMDVVPPDIAAQRIREAKARGGVATMLPPAPPAFGLSDENDIAYVKTSQVGAKHRSRG